MWPPFSLFVGNCAAHKSALSSIEEVQSLFRKSCQWGRKKPLGADLRTNKLNPKWFRVRNRNWGTSIAGIEIEARVSPESKLRHLITWKVNGWIKLIFLIVFVQFVCHPYSQLALNSEVYKNVPYLEKSSWKQAVLLLLAAVAFPLLLLVWLVTDLCCPNHSISRMFHSPCVKFLITCGSYQTFLFLLALTSFHSSQSDEFLEYSVVGT